MQTLKVWIGVLATPRNLVSKILRCEKMVVEWAKNEAEKSQALVMVDVSELNLEVGGKQIKELPAKDLTSDEWLVWQQSPIVLEQAGKIDEAMSARSQMYSIVIAVARLKKGDPKLDLDPLWLRHNWTITKIVKLIVSVSKAFGEVEKNLLDSESPKQDSSS